ncbi:MAG: hypothetical protein SVT52_08750, partial [Planctomycetota bacterium]|nr:hypothetical protein [Planctomycetota bacterium]
EVPILGTPSCFDGIHPDVTRRSAESLCIVYKYHALTPMDSDPWALRGENRVIRDNQIFRPV